VFDLRQQLLGIVQTLDAAKIPYALCGGLAVVLHGFPRATKDVDLLLLPGDIERTHAALKELGYVLKGGPLTFRGGKPEEQQIHRISRVLGQELITIDLLVVGPALQDVWAQREVFELDGVRLVAVSRSGLLKMKRLSGCPQDLADVEHLESGSHE
jgi:hypothetical protein